MLYKGNAYEHLLKNVNGYMLLAVPNLKDLSSYHSKPNQTAHIYVHDLK